MLTNYFLKRFIEDYYKKYKCMSLDKLDVFIENYNYKEEFHIININRVKGDIFEYIAKYYFLLSKPTVYLWKEIPLNIRAELNLTTKDKGIDLIYKCSDKWIGIQCKWRSKTNNCINKNEVGGFIIELNRTKLAYGIMFTNVNKPTAYHLNSCKWIIRPELNKSINDDFIKFIFEQNTIPIVPAQHKEIILRDYQLEALNNIRNCTDKNMKVIMACGTGKSIIMTQLINDYSNKKVICLMPSLQLISQFYKLLTRIIKDLNILCICSHLDSDSLTGGEISDENIKKNLLDEFIALDPYVLYTTEPLTIAKKLQSNSIIVLCTYHSSHLLNNCHFNLGIFDEAHKTVNNNCFGFMLHDKNCNIDKRIYFTATPRYHVGDKDKCVSMDNKQIYGNEVFNYSFKKAIENKYILDFQIITYAVPPELNDIIDKNILTKMKYPFHQI